jgi:hypothetical protein
LSIARCYPPELYAAAFLAGHHTRGASWLSALPSSSLDGWFLRSYSSGLSTVRQSACQNSYCLQTVRAMRIRGQLCCEFVWPDAGSLSVTVSNRTAQRGRQQQLTFFVMQAAQRHTAPLGVGCLLAMSESSWGLCNALQTCLCSVSGPCILSSWSPMQVRACLCDQQCVK